MADHPADVQLDMNPVTGKRIKDQDEGVMLEELKRRKKMFDGFKSFMKFVMSNLGIFFVCVFYAIIGARLFINIELPAEELRREEKKALEETIINREKYIMDAAWAYIKHEKYNFSEEVYYQKIDETLHMHTQFILECTEMQYNGLEDIDGWEYDWNFYNTLLFCISIITTIGYGNISPVTFAGQMFTILYAMIGLPLFFIFLSSIGNVMADAFKLVYSRICCRPCRIVRRTNEYPGKSLKLLKKRLIDDDVGLETWMPTEYVGIPIIICLMIIVGFLWLGTVLFHHVEGWDMATATYFCFITLTTIGFGDFYPVKAFEVDSSNLFTYVVLIMSVSYCVIGVALISMIIATIQENMQLKAERMTKKLFGNNKKVTLDSVTVKNKYRLTDDGLFDFKGIQGDEVLNDENRGVSRPASSVSGGSSRPTSSRPASRTSAAASRPGTGSSTAAGSRPGSGGSSSARSRPGTGTSSLGSRPTSADPQNQSDETSNEDSGTEADATLLEDMEDE